MPGYERDRFESLTQSEVDEFTCGICLAILKRPAVVPCCRHTYCYGCISEWLKNKNSCPNDRLGLTQNQLYDPQRLVVNLLAKLRIRCDFCQTVLDLQCLQSHEDNCLLNPNRKCSDCGLKMDDQQQQQRQQWPYRQSSSTHDCVNSLKSLNTSLAEEVLQLKTELQRLTKEMRSLKEKNVSNNESNNEYDHISEVMASARTRISYPEITYCSMPSALRIKAINKSKEAILAFDSYKQITEFLNKEFNGDSHNYNDIKWYTIAHCIQCGQSLIANQNGYIDLRFGRLRIAIFSAGARISSS